MASSTVRELDLDHLVEGVVRPAADLSASPNGRKKLVGVQLHPLPEVQMKPSPDRPACFATTGPPAAT